MSRSGNHLLAAVCLGACLVGCGGEARESLVPVAGKLEVDGKPMGGVTIFFTPTGAKKSRGGTALTDDQGSFTVMHTAQQKPGLAVGDYLVAYSKLAMPDG